MKDAPEADSGPLLEVTDLKTHFLTPRGRRAGRRRGHASLARGTTLGVVGESGSGKTIFSRSVMNLLPKENVRRSGSVMFMGRELVDARRQGDAPHLRRRDGDGLPGPDELAQPGHDDRQADHRVVAPAPRNEPHEAKISAVTLLRSVNIPEAERRFDEYPHQLSGGMRQRVMIALALACGPRLLFADEPTTALDVTVQAEILNLLQDQQADRFMAMVLVTHDLGVVAGRTDEIAVMYAGRDRRAGPTSVLFSKMRHPYTEALLRSIPKVEEPEPHPPARRSPAGRRTCSTRRPAARSPAVPVRPGALPGRGPALESTGSHRPPLRLLLPARHARERRGAGAQPGGRAAAGRRPARRQGGAAVDLDRAARRRDGDAP